VGIERVEATEISPEQFTGRFMQGRGQPAIIKGIPQNEGSHWRHLDEMLGLIFFPFPFLFFSVSFSILFRFLFYSFFAWFVDCIYLISSVVYFVSFFFFFFFFFLFFFYYYFFSSCFLFFASDA
jgi:hypothetical protein